MTRRIECCLFGLLAWWPCLGVTGEPAPPVLVTDRPDFTESALAVPAWYLQLEGGLGYAAREGGQSLALPELLLRFGVGGGGELRLQAPSILLDFPEGAPHGSVVGPIALGGKYVVPLVDSFSVGVLGMLSLPVESEAFSEQGLTLDFKLLAALEATAWLSVAFNLGASIQGLAGAGSARDQGYLASLSLGFEARPADASAVLQAGFTFLAATHWQLDGYLGMDLRGAPRALVAGLGGAVLW